MNSLRAALFALHPTVLLLILPLAAVCAMSEMVFDVVSLAPKALVALIVTRYAFALLEHAADGHGEPPTLSVDMVSPTELRPVLLTALYYALWLMIERFGGAHVASLWLLALLLLPAGAAALGVCTRLLEAVNPLTWLRMVRGFGPWYLLLLAVAWAYALACGWIVDHVNSRFAFFVALQICCLSLFALTGQLIWTRRWQLGFTAAISPERSAERHAAERQRQLDQLLDELFILQRQKKARSVDQRLQNWLGDAQQPPSPAERRTLLERMAGWDNAPLLQRAASACIARSFELAQPDAAVSEAEFTLRLLPDFAPDSEHLRQQLLHRARITGRTVLAETLSARAAARPP